MVHLLVVACVSLVGYALFCGLSLYLVTRFHWLACFREIRPRQCCQHLLSYGVLLLYLTYTAWEHHGSGFFTSDVSLSSSLRSLWSPIDSTVAGKQKRSAGVTSHAVPGSGPSNGEMLYELLAATLDAVLAGYSRPWSFVPPSTSPASASGSDSNNSGLSQLFFSVALSAAAQAIAATLLYGTFAVWCATRWRCAALRAAERHADVWSFLFPSAQSSAALMLATGDVSFRGSLEQSVDSLTWGLTSPVTPVATQAGRRGVYGTRRGSGGGGRYGGGISPPPPPPFPSSIASSSSAAATAVAQGGLAGLARRVSRPGAYGFMGRAPSRRLRTLTRDTVTFGLPHFRSVASAGATAAASSSSSPLQQQQEEQQREDDEMQQQRRALLRMRQDFLSAFWCTDATVFLITWLMFSGLAACRVAVTVTVASFSVAAAAAAARSSGAGAAQAALFFTPYPTEGYVALVGLAYLVALRLRLRHCSRLLGDITRALRAPSTARATPAAGGGGAEAVGLATTTATARQRRARLLHLVNAAGGRGGRTGLGRPPRRVGGGASSFPLSPNTPLGPSTTGGQKQEEEEQQQPTLQAASPSSMQSAIFYLNPEDTARPSVGSGSLNTTTTTASNSDNNTNHKEENQQDESFMQRWKRRLPSAWQHTPQEEEQEEEPKRKVMDAAEAFAKATSSSPASTARAAPSGVDDTQHNAPPFRYALVATITLVALQVLPDTAAAWAAVLAVTAACAAATCQHALWGVCRWLATDYRAMLQCSLWTLFFSRGFTPSSMDVTKALRQLSQQQRRHLMVLQAFGANHTHPASTVEEEEEWVTEETAGSFAANALVEVAITAPAAAAAAAAAGGSLAAPVTTVTPDLLRPSHYGAESVDTASLSTSSAATAVAILGGARDMAFGVRRGGEEGSAVVSLSSSSSSFSSHRDAIGGVDFADPFYSADDDQSQFDDDLASSRHGRQDTRDGVVRAISPTQFWHGVAAKVLLQSAASASPAPAPVSMQGGGSWHDSMGGAGAGGLGAGASASGSSSTVYAGGLFATNSFAGPASTALTSSFAAVPQQSPPPPLVPGLGVPMVQVTNSSLSDATGVAPTFPNSSFLGVVDPFRVAAPSALAHSPLPPPASSATVIANALMPATPGLELGTTAHRAFHKEKLKGSMLLTAPAAARVGAAAEKEAEERREAERREREEYERAEAAAARAAREAEDEERRQYRLRWEQQQEDNDPQQQQLMMGEDGFLTDASPFSPTEMHPVDVLDTTPSEPLNENASFSDRWLSRALATVVPSILGGRSAQPSRAGSGSGGSSRGSPPRHNSPHTEGSQRQPPYGDNNNATERSGDRRSNGYKDAMSSSELPADVMHSLSFAGSFSNATSATASALLQGEEGFARFLSAVRRDGDNTYALQNLLTSHGHTYGKRVDAKGRSALHYAVMGGFVHGVWFLVKIGAEPNLLDKAGYAPLHYAVLYHTEHCLSPNITDENSSKAVQSARHMLGIPVVASAAVRAPEQARKRRQRRQQRHRRDMQQRLEAAYAATSTAAATSTTVTTHSATAAAVTTMATSATTTTTTATTATTSATSRRGGVEGVGGSAGGKTSSNSIASSSSGSSRRRGHGAVGIGSASASSAKRSVHTTTTVTSDSAAVVQRGVHAENRVVSEQERETKGSTRRRRGSSSLGSQSNEEGRAEGRADPSDGEEVQISGAATEAVLDHLDEQHQQLLQQQQHRRGGGGGDDGPCPSLLGSDGPLSAEDGLTPLAALLPSGGIMHRHHRHGPNTSSSSSSSANGDEEEEDESAASDDNDDDDDSTRQNGYEDAVPSMAVVAAAAAVPEEGGQWYGMVGRLLSLGAQVDFPTARGLTALHLAVLQGSIGLINTLLREGANPLLGSELETPSFMAAANAAPWEEGCADSSEVDSSAAWIAQIHAEFQRPGRRPKPPAAAAAATTTNAVEGGGDVHDNGGGKREDAARAGAVVVSSSSPPRSTAASSAAASSGESAGHPLVFTPKLREWFDVHVTNAGNPIAMGYCKSPLLLAVELDADLAVASMLHHATLQATTARVVAAAALPPLSSGPLGGVGGGDAASVPLSQSRCAGYQGGAVQPSSSMTSTSLLQLPPPSPSSSAAQPRDDSAALLLMSSSTNTNTSAAGTGARPPSARVESAAAPDSPTATAAAGLRRPPLAPSPILRSSVSPMASAAAPATHTAATASVSSHSKEPSVTAAYLSSAPHSIAPATIMAQPRTPLRSAEGSVGSGGNGGGGSTHVSFATEPDTPHADAAVVATPLPLPTVITAADSNNNNSSSSCAGPAMPPAAVASVTTVDPLLLLPLQNPADSAAAAAADTIATTITAMAATWTQTGWERPCTHGFNAIHVALVLGNAQVVRVLLLRWTYSGTSTTAAAAAGGSSSSGGGVISEAVGARDSDGDDEGAHGGADPSVSEVALLSSSSALAPTAATTTATTTTGQTDAESVAVALMRAAAPTLPAPLALGLADALPPPTIAQITVPVYDDAEETGAAVASGVTAGETTRTDGSPLQDCADCMAAAAAAEAQEKEEEARRVGAHQQHHHPHDKDDAAGSAVNSSQHPHHCHHHHHHHPHSTRSGADGAQATLSLTTSIGATAFWVAPLRLNFFHLAAIGDSTECLAYVLRWRGVPDYVPCALDDAFRDEVLAEEARRNVEVVLTATAAQDAYHRRRTHHRELKRRGNRHAIRQAVRPAESAPALPGQSNQSSPFSSTGVALSAMEGVGQSAVTTTTPASGAAAGAGVVPSSFPESPSTSSSSGSGGIGTVNGGGSRKESVLSGSRTAGNATAAPTLCAANMSDAGDLPTPPPLHHQQQQEEAQGMRAAGGAVVSSADGVALPPHHHSNAHGGLSLIPASSSCLSSTTTVTQTAEFSPTNHTHNHKGDDDASSACASDVFNRTWSSGRPSAETASSAGGPRRGQRNFAAAAGAASAATPAISRRAKRQRARQRTFMQAFVTLLQTNVRGDAVRRRVRTTVFGRGGAGAVLRHLMDGAKAHEKEEGEEGDGEEATLRLASQRQQEQDLADLNGVMAKTCFGSTAAAAALHTGMTVCYATMNNLLREDGRRHHHHRRHYRYPGEGDDNNDDDDDECSCSSDCSSASSHRSHSSNNNNSVRSSRSSSARDGTEAAKKPYKEKKAAVTVRETTQHPTTGNSSKTLSLPPVKDRVQLRRSERAARQLREEERLQHLRQQRRRAFVSAVAKLRQCIVGVPIDLAHLAAVEMAVDRACVALPTAKARRTLQQALLIVTRRLQNQHRRQQLVDGLRRSAEAQKAAARSARAGGRSALSTSRRSATRGPRREVSFVDLESSLSSSLATSSTFNTTTTTTTTTTIEQGHQWSVRSTPKPEGHQRLDSSGNNNNNSQSLPPQRQGRRRRYADSPLHRPKAPSQATSATSYYSTHDTPTSLSGVDLLHTTAADEAELALNSEQRRLADLHRALRRRQLQQQQRLLRLLAAVATELNAVDTRGLTPLHYAIANQNASMVYLLCAYGATFVFASEQTEEHLVGHPAEVVAAAAAAALDSGSPTHDATTTAGGGGGGSSLTTSVSEAEPSRLAATSPATVSPVTPFTVTATSINVWGSPRGHRSAASASAGSGLSGSLSTSAAFAATTASPSTIAAVRAQLAAPAINAATDVLSYFSDFYHAQLTPLTQAALRRAAKTGSAEFLLLRLPTREEAARERQTLADERAVTTMTATTAAPAAGSGATPTTTASVDVDGIGMDVPGTANTSISGYEVTVPSSTALTQSRSAALPPFAPPLLTTVTTTTTTTAATTHAASPTGGLSSPASSCSLVSVSTAQPTTMAVTLTEALGLGANGSFTAAALSGVRRGEEGSGSPGEGTRGPTGGEREGGKAAAAAVATTRVCGDADGDETPLSVSRSQAVATTTTPSHAIEKEAATTMADGSVTHDAVDASASCAAVMAVVPLDELSTSVRGLQAQLLHQEDKALQQLVSGVNYNAAANSIAAPVASLSADTGVMLENVEATRDEAQAMMLRAAEGEGDGWLFSDCSHGGVTTIAAGSPAHGDDGAVSAVATLSSLAGGTHAAHCTPQPRSGGQHGDLAGADIKSSVSGFTATATDTATGAHAAKAAAAASVYALLEPHDVFLTHMVRNPTKADSIVRAAMEGTALRYLFQASVAAGKMDAMHD